MRASRFEVDAKLSTNTLLYYRCYYEIHASPIHGNLIAHRRGAADRPEHMSCGNSSTAFCVFPGAGIIYECTTKLPD